MFDQASFWIGFVFGISVFISFGLVVGAISFSVTISKDGVKVKDNRD